MPDLPISAYLVRNFVSFIIFLSVLRKDFVTPPYSQQIQLGSQAQLRCHPPKGNPAARVIHWEKNGVKINDANFIQSSDGHLIIVQANMKSAGNYTCVASNDVITRRSTPATITIYGKILIYLLLTQPGQL